MNYVEIKMTINKAGGMALITAFLSAVGMCFWKPLWRVAAASSITVGAAVAMLTLIEKEVEKENGNGR